MIKSASIFNGQCLALVIFNLLIALQMDQADTALVTVTITQRSPIETLSPSGDVTGVSEATVGTRYTLMSSDGQQVILQDAQGTQYRIALSATNYTPAVPAASTAPTPATKSGPLQAPSPATVTSAAPPPPPATDQAPVMSGSKTIQFAGACPSPLQHSPYIQYDFNLNQEHFWLDIPPGYDGSQPWGLIVYTTPGPKHEELPEGWNQVLIDDKLLFICPQQDGNDQPNSRREGLAVIAALAMMKLYSIDPNRVYAVGFSGGTRIASNLGFHQSDIFHATIQCSGSNFDKPVPRAAVTDADLQKYPEPYGLLDAEPQEVDRAKKSVKFVLITGDADFRQHFLEDIYNGGFKNDGFNATLLNVPEMKHEPCPAHTLREALAFIEQVQ